jgi:hypothetical protein
MGVCILIAEYVPILYWAHCPLDQTTTAQRPRLGQTEKERQKVCFRSRFRSRTACLYTVYQI